MIGVKNSFVPFPASQWQWASASGGMTKLPARSMVWSIVAGSLSRKTPFSVNIVAATKVVPLNHLPLVSLRVGGTPASVGRTALAGYIRPAPENTRVPSAKAPAPFNTVRRETAAA